MSNYPSRVRLVPDPKADIRRAATIRALGVVLLFVWTAGCADSSGPRLPAVGAQTPSETSGLLLPAEGAQVPQNDADLGCDDNATRGRGFRLTFAWAAVLGAASYQLYVKNTGAVYPVIDATVRDTALARTFCNAFVIDRNLTGWEWSVRAVSPDGSIGPVVGPRHFSFLPCRIGNGRSCYAPAQ